MTTVEEIYLEILNSSATSQFLTLFHSADIDNGYRYRSAQSISKVEWGPRNRLPHTCPYRGDALNGPLSKDHIFCSIHFRIILVGCNLLRTKSNHKNSKSSQSMRAKEKCLSTIQDIPPSDRLDTGPQKNPNYFQTYGIARCLERFEWRLIDGVLLRFIGIDNETCKAA